MSDLVRSEVEAALPPVGSFWVWEPMKPHAAALVAVGDVRWNGEEWWVGVRSDTGEPHWVDLGRWAEATVFVAEDEVAAARAWLSTQAFTEDGSFTPAVNKADSVKVASTPTEPTDEMVEEVRHILVTTPGLYGPGEPSEPARTTAERIVSAIGRVTEEKV